MIYSIDVPEKFFEQEKEDNWLVKFFKLFGNSSVSEIAKQDKYVLTDYIDIRVKNQETTLGCWAFSILSSMETNIAKNQNIYKDFSEKHMTYATARNFIDGTNEKGFNRTVAMGGTHEIGLAYLTNGQGAVLEELMPFDLNTNSIYLNEINLPTDTHVSGYEKLPSIYKLFDSEGNITYSDGVKTIYTEEEVEAIRNKIKETIVEHGGVVASSYASNLDYYNNEDLTKATSFFCDNNSAIRDHGFTIIGWDDNYSKENFNSKHRPKSDGAYIVLNSYGEEFFDSGYLYVSYEDIIIENSLYAITDTSEEEHKNIYQHDFFGGLGYLGNEGWSVGYYSNVYDRQTNETEILDYVGVTIPDYVKLNIYVNPTGDSLIQEDLVKVASTDELNPGYHKIKINPIELTDKKFSIVIEQISENDRFLFSIEPNIPSTIYDVVTAESGNSKISLDGKNWYDLSYLNVDISILDISKTDVCIKGFTRATDETEEDYFESEKYDIGEKYIKNIEANTKLEEFLENISTNQDIEIEISDKDLIKTGMNIKVGNNIYTLVVTGDINADGNVSLIDISKLILHYNEEENYILENEFKEAGDLNLDGKISLIDISKLILIYNQI